MKLRVVREGMFLLGDDSLLDRRVATYLFREPERVLAIHRGGVKDEGPFQRDGYMVVRAMRDGADSDQSIYLEMTGREGGQILFRFPDDRHLVAAVNFPN